MGSLAIGTFGDEAEEEREGKAMMWQREAR